MRGQATVICNLVALNDRLDTRVPHWQHSLQLCLHACFYFTYSSSSSIFLISLRLQPLSRMEAQILCRCSPLRRKTIGPRKEGHCTGPSFCWTCFPLHCSIVKENTCGCLSLRRRGHLSFFSLLPLTNPKVEWIVCCTVPNGPKCSTVSCLYFFDRGAHFSVIGPSSVVEAVPARRLFAHRLNALSASPFWRTVSSVSFYLSPPFPLTASDVAH